MYSSSANRFSLHIVISIFTVLVFYPVALPASDNPADGIHEELNVQSEKRLRKAAELIDLKSFKDAEKILLEFDDSPLVKGKVQFLLGLLYREKGDDARAEHFLAKAAVSYPLLEDYALKLLAELYMEREQFEDAVETVRRIQNKILQQEAKLIEINSLINLNKDNMVISALAGYVDQYSDDWDSRLTLAMLYKNKKITDKAIGHFRIIYLNDTPFSADAFTELKSLKADTFTEEENLKRAGKLYKNGNFSEAETAYEEILESSDDDLNETISFKIGMCRFRLKRYSDAALIFGQIRGPKAMYWQARSFFRIDDRPGFDRVLEEFEIEFPGHERLAGLFLMSAEDHRRAGNISTAEKEYRKVLKEFPDRKEDALWGLGWMYYTAGDYRRSIKYFSELSGYRQSRNYYKYLYWKARAMEKQTEDCMALKVSSKKNRSDECSGRSENYFAGLPSNEGYYGYLIKFRSGEDILPEKIELQKPLRPDGKAYERIEALTFLGLRDEAAKEMVAVLQKAGREQEFLYLGYMAKEVQEYKGLIAVAEMKDKREFLPLSYPLGYWASIEPAAQKNGMDPYLIAAVIREESRFDPKAVSWAGAIGLMQLMPSTAHRLKGKVKVDIAENEDIHDTENNIQMGAYYLFILLKEFKKIPFALAAYNAGETSLKSWLSRFNNREMDAFIEEITYRETRRYVKKVLKSYWQYRTVYGLPVEGY